MQGIEVYKYEKIWKGSWTLEAIKAESTEESV